MDKDKLSRKPLNKLRRQYLNPFIPNARSFIYFIAFVWQYATCHSTCYTDDKHEAEPSLMPNLVMKYEIVRSWQTVTQVQKSHNL